MTKILKKRIEEYRKLVKKAQAFRRKAIQKAKIVDDTGRAKPYPVGEDIRKYSLRIPSRRKDFTKTLRILRKRFGSPKYSPQYIIGKEYKDNWIQGLRNMNAPDDLINKFLHMRILKFYEMYKGGFIVKLAYIYNKGDLSNPFIEEQWNLIDLFEDSHRKYKNEEKSSLDLLQRKRII